MKRNEIFAACFMLFVLIGAVVLSFVLIGGYGLILSTAFIAPLLGGSEDHDRQTDSRNA